MPKINQWREIFQSARKEKMRVRVGEKYVDMTFTQAYRLDELTEDRRFCTEPDAAVGPEKTHYSLAEASAHLNVSEEKLLQNAAFGSISFYINAAGLMGRWLRRMTDGGSRVSSVQTLQAGYLALSSRSCSDLTNHKSVNVSVLEFHRPADSSAIVLDRESMAILSAWGDCDRFFCLREPLSVDRNTIVLLDSLQDLARNK